METTLPELPELVIECIASYTSWDFVLNKMSMLNKKYRNALYRTGFMKRFKKEYNRLELYRSIIKTKYHTAINNLYDAELKMLDPTKIQCVVKDSRAHKILESRGWKFLPEINIDVRVTDGGAPSKLNNTDIASVWTRCKISPVNEKYQFVNQHWLIYHFDMDVAKSIITSGSKPIKAVVLPVDFEFPVEGGTIKVAEYEGRSDRFINTATGFVIKQHYGSGLVVGVKRGNGELEPLTPAERQLAYRLGLAVLRERGEERIDF